EYALAQYANKTVEAIFAAHNVTCDWGFAEAAFEEFGIWNRMDYHRIDMFTLAWTKLRHSGHTQFNLAGTCKFLEIPEEPIPHRGINGARCAAEIYRKLMRA